MNPRFPINVSRIAILSALLMMSVTGCTSMKEAQSTGLVQVSSMHEAVGQQQHHGRISVVDLTAKPHFYGVGALEGLRGEVTIVNSQAIMTGVSSNGEPTPISNSATKATMFVGQSSRNWNTVSIPSDVAPEQFDETIANMAVEHGVDIDSPFVFVIEGEFTDVRLHVINGACPIHARMQNTPLEKDTQSYDMEAMTVKGTLVGVHAADSVGKLTHPATNIHAHLIFIDPTNSNLITGHIERVGLGRNAVLKIPAGDRKESKVTSGV